MVADREGVVVPQLQENVIGSRQNHKPSIYMKQEALMVILKSKVEQEP